MPATRLTPPIELRARASTESAPNAPPGWAAGGSAPRGSHGSAAATYETLAALHALHPAAIPFENLDPLLGNPVALDLDSLYGKLVSPRRGGCCFEHNTLLKAVRPRLRSRAFVC